MIQIEFADSDLARVRFGHSPMAEVVTSLYALRRTAKFWMYDAWRTALLPRLREAAPRTLLAVTGGPGGYVPDFLTPLPVVARPALAGELAEIAATPLDRVAMEVAAGWAGTEAPPEAGRFATDPAGGLAELVTDIRRYFAVAVAPHWPRLRAAVEAELAQRAARAVEHGPRALVTDLHPGLSWDGSALRLATVADRESSLDGHPLTLMPAGFSGPWVHTVMNAPDGRALWYPPHGLGRLWDQPVPAPSEALAALLGPTRAAVLTLLAEPDSTGGVAKALGLAPATASHHLTTLRDAGLVAARRVGRRLCYARTPLGQSLAAGA
ncbi:ArsR/SmtB family transcription factor [Longispora albida]|uniref:ArsR/SmtB family transcription factor n=1 Tax=Longispora albida TaxID=203523 RepID=UPI0003721C4C|nr:winged helix-turn-helix domain-containing protein [Longispora albida]